MKTTTWLVRRSGFPFTTHGQPLGTVDAATRDAAKDAAELEYGGRVTVEPRRPTNEPLERAVAKAEAHQRAKERRGFGPARHQKRAPSTDHESSLETES